MYTYTYACIFIYIYMTGDVNDCTSKSVRTQRHIHCVRLYVAWYLYAQSTCGIEYVYIYIYI